MSGQVNKEALFNEVKGSLFEYLVALKLAQSANIELEFIKNIDKNYLGVLGQQDRMVRQFYPEMLSFLNEASVDCQREIIAKYGTKWVSIKLLGKLSRAMQDDLKETDLLLINDKGEQILLSLKLNKKSSFVNTKSAGVRSFLTQYFPFLDFKYQNDFSQIIDVEFQTMSDHLHRLNDLDFIGDYNSWVNAGFSELPGDLSEVERDVLKKYYAKIALRLHGILEKSLEVYPQEFLNCLFPLMGFSDKNIVQVVCFHDFKSGGKNRIEIHAYDDIFDSNIKIKEFRDTASVEVDSKLWTLQIRIKPMNKFTTTAMKVNCAVKFKN